jgi:hypothetical protein
VPSASAHQGVERIPDRRSERAHQDRKVVYGSTTEEPRLAVVGRDTSGCRIPDLADYVEGDSATEGHVPVCDERVDLSD